MTIGFVFAIFDLDEYRQSSLSHDDIEFTSLDLVVAIDDLVSPRLQISHSDILSYISDGAIGLCHIFFMIIQNVLFQKSTKNFCFPVSFLYLYQLNSLNHKNSTSSQTVRDF